MCVAKMGKLRYFWGLKFPMGIRGVQLAKSFPPSLSVSLMPAFPSLLLLGARIDASQAAE
jgi:hypothetical protein